MKAVITGSAGYIGSALFKYFDGIKNGTCVGVDRNYSNTTTVVSDLSSHELKLKHMQKADVFFHLAGLFEKDFNKRNHIPFELYRKDNVVTTYHSAEFADKIDAHLVFSSTLLLSEVPISDHPYVITKKMAEETILTFRCLSHAICRLPRVLGFIRSQLERTESWEANIKLLPFDIVSHFLQQAIYSNSIDLYSENLFRYYIHLKDAISCLNECKKKTGIIQPCLYNPITIGKIATKVIEVAKKFGIPVRLNKIIRKDTKPNVSFKTDNFHSDIKAVFPSGEELINSVVEEYFEFVFNGTSV